MVFTISIRITMEKIMESIMIMLLLRSRLIFLPANLTKDHFSIVCTFPGLAVAPLYLLASIGVSAKILCTASTNARISETRTTAAVSR